MALYDDESSDLSSWSQITNLQRYVTLLYNTICLFNITTSTYTNETNNIHTYHKAIYIYT